jgi:hypothetical protein
VISFEAVVRILFRDVASGGQQFIEHLGIPRSPVDVQLDRAWAAVERTGEEPASGLKIPFLRDEDIDDLTELVDRPVQSAPGCLRSQFV